MSFVPKIRCVGYVPSTERNRSDIGFSAQQLSTLYLQRDGGEWERGDTVRVNPVHGSTSWMAGDDFDVNFNRPEAKEIKNRTAAAPPPLALHLQLLVAEFWLRNNTEGHGIVVIIFIKGENLSLLLGGVEDSDQEKNKHKKKMKKEDGLMFHIIFLDGRSLLSNSSSSSSSNLCI